MTDKTKKTKKTEKTKKIKKPRPSKVIRKLVEIIDTERIDDIPLLWVQLQAMGVMRLIDKHFPRHANWEGELSAGEVLTIELMLKAFEGLSLVVGKDEQGQTVTWLKPLSELQKRILDLLGFSHDVYLRLVTNFQNLAPE